MVAMPASRQRAMRVLHAGTQRVGERDEADEREALDAVAVGPAVGPPRHGQDAKALGGQGAIVVLEPSTRVVVEHVRPPSDCRCVDRSSTVPGAPFTRSTRSPSGVSWKVAIRRVTGENGTSRRRGHSRASTPDVQSRLDGGHQQRRLGRIAVQRTARGLHLDGRVVDQRGDREQPHERRVVAGSRASDRPR